MTNNFPCNDEAISEAVETLKETDPDGFFHMQQRLEELMELSPRDARLLMDLKEAVPFNVTIPKQVHERDPKVFPAEREVVSKAYS